MNNELNYKAILESSSRELTRLMEEREELDDIREKLAHRINSVRDLVFALSNILNEDPYKTHPELFPELIVPETGFTDALREVLKSSEKYLSPVDIRDALKERRYSLEKYKNPLAAIHQTLRRLVDAKEIEKHPDEDKKLYKWKRPVATTRVFGSVPYGTVSPLAELAIKTAEEAKEKRDIQEARNKIAEAAAKAAIEAMKKGKK